jgi:hypothetical protein
MSLIVHKLDSADGWKGLGTPVLGVFLHVGHLLEMPLFIDTHRAIGLVELGCNSKKENF